MLDALNEKGFEILFESHATAILERDFPSALIDIESAFSTFEIPITEMIGSGGGETLGTQRMRHALNARGWYKTNFEIKKSIAISVAGATGTIVDIEHQSTSHEIDHVKAFTGNFAGKKLIALESNGIIRILFSTAILKILKGSMPKEPSAWALS